ncbi:Ribosomal protein S11 superfamily [Sesbania bispinosa]|nr:Ribosomal protein S11 superfamily [Sesbania bispinosa]
MLACFSCSVCRVLLVSFEQPGLEDLEVKLQRNLTGIMHRGTSKVISVATTNSKDLRNSLPSLTDHNACRIVGRLIAERSKEADVYALAYEPRKNERIEGKLGIVIDTIKENGILFV